VRDESVGDVICTGDVISQVMQSVGVISVISAISAGDIMVQWCNQCR
jgi:hypothetical protein